MQVSPDSQDRPAKEGSEPIQNPEPIHCQRDIPNTTKRVEYISGEFWLRLSQDEWETAGITTRRAKQLLGDELFQSMINEINQKNWPLPDPKKELVTGIQQTVRDFFGGKWGNS
jgi:hypothetical protein